MFPGTIIMVPFIGDFEASKSDSWGYLEVGRRACLDLVPLDDLGMLPMLESSCRISSTSALFSTESMTA